MSRDKSSRGGEGSIGSVGGCTALARGETSAEGEEERPGMPSHKKKDLRSMITG